MMDSGVVEFVAPKGRPFLAQGATLGIGRTGKNRPQAPEGRPSEILTKKRVGATLALSGLGEIGAHPLTPGLHPGLTTVALSGLQEKSTLESIMSLN